MTDREGVFVPITCDCGHQFNEPIAGVELESYVFTCPSCGKSDRFPKDQIAKMVSEYEAAVDSVNKAVKKAAKDISSAFKRNN